MTVEVQPIQTEYKGYRFRSRLEARWAVFFDSLAVPWEYEREGYQLPNGDMYLPDFWLPEQKCWIEIKPTAPDQEEEDKASALAIGTGFPVFMFYGQIPFVEPPVDGAFVFPAHDSESAHKLFPSGGWDSCHVWCECPACGMVGIQFDGRADRLPCRDTGCPGDGRRDDKGYNPSSPRLIRAYRAARSARFEHGESGAGRTRRPELIITLDGH